MPSRTEHCRYAPGALASQKRRGRCSSPDPPRSPMTATEPAVQTGTADPLTAGPNPVVSGRRTAFQHTMIYVFVAGPMVALAAAVPLAWGWGVDWHDLLLL